jgi:cell wall-associated NlpC family hydrolase
MEKYVGIPYKELDCWGLVKKFYAEEYKIILKSYYDKPPMDKDISKDIAYSGMADFTQVEFPMHGDIVLIKILGVPCHVGVYLEGNKLLHTREKSGSVIDRFNKWSKMVEGYYRL